MRNVKLFENFDENSEEEEFFEQMMFNRFPDHVEGQHGKKEPNTYLIDSEGDDYFVEVWFTAEDYEKERDEINRDFDEYLAGLMPVRFGDDDWNIDIGEHDPRDNGITISIINSNFER